MKLQFNIKTWMLVVVMWALPNALLGWMIRAYPAGFSHPGIQVWQICMGWNAVFAIFAIFGLCMHAALLYRRRGRTTAQTNADNRDDLIRNAPIGRVVTLLIFFSIIFRYYKRFFWSYGLHYGHLAVLIFVATVATVIRCELRKRPTRRDWTPASLVLLTSRIMNIAWIIGMGFLFFVYKPHLAEWGFGPAFPIPPSFLLIMFGAMALGSLSVVSMRRVEQEDKTKAGQLPPD